MGGPREYYANEISQSEKDRYHMTYLSVESNKQNKLTGQIDSWRAGCQLWRVIGGRD